MEKNLENGSRNIISLIGPSGSGKSILAKTYAIQHRNNYDIVWWLQNSSDPRKQYVNLAKSINLAEKKSIINEKDVENIIFNINNYLRTTHFKWLIIFDNINNKSEIENIIPKSQNHHFGHTIITSIPSISTQFEISVHNFTPQESVQLIQTENVNINANQALSISSELNHFPLAVSLMSQTIKQNHLSTHDLENKEFITFLNENNKEKSQQAIHFTASKVKQESQSAFDFLKIISTLRNEDIPEEILYLIQSKTLNSGSETYNAIQSLSRYQLLLPAKAFATKNSSRRRYFIHEHIKYAIYDSLSDAEKAEYCTMLTTAVVNWLSQKPKAALSYDMYYMLEQITELTDVLYREDIFNEDGVKLLLNLMEYHQLVERNFKQALNISKKIERISTKVNLTQETIARFNSNLAGLKWWIGDVSGGIPNCLEVIDSYKKMNKSHHELTRAHLYYISHFNFTGQINEAKKQLEILDKNLEKNNTPENDDFNIYNKALYHQIKGTTLLGLGDVETSLYEVNLALDELKQIARKYPSPDMFLSRYLQYYTNMHEIKYHLGKSTPNEMRELLERAKEVLHTENHRLIGMIYILLGNAEVTQESNPSAGFKHLEKGIYILDQWFPENIKHKEQGLALYLLGESYAQQGNHEKAIQSLLRADMIYSNAYSKMSGFDIQKLYKLILSLSVSTNDILLFNEYSAKYYENFGIRVTKDQLS